MKFISYQDRKRFIMPSRGNCLDSTQVMEKAFQNIMDEIIEHVIEGICFEAHRAAQLGYFAVSEYIVRNFEFKFCEGKCEPDSDVKPGVDIFGNDERLKVISICPCCRGKKEADTLGRHVTNCRSRPIDGFIWVSKENGVNKEEEEEDICDGNDNFDRKKGSDSKKQARSAKKYDTMTIGEKHDFLRKYCGVISRHTGKPCGNLLNCNKHSLEKKEEVRKFISKSFAEQFLDSNIDVDTVD